MKSSSLVLIAETEFAAGTTVITGTRQKGVGYYLGQGNGQNIRFIADDYPGIVTIQASLDTDPKTKDSYLPDYPDALMNQTGLMYMYFLEIVQWMVQLQLQQITVFTCLENTHGYEQ